MPDDKSMRDKRDRGRVAAEQDFEARYFAQEAGISLEQAKELIERFGHDRDTLLRGEPDAEEGQLNSTLDTRGAHLRSRLLTEPRAVL